MSEMTLTRNNNGENRHDRRARLAKSVKAAKQFGRDWHDVTDKAVASGVYWLGGTPRGLVRVFANSTHSVQLYVDPFDDRDSELLRSSLDGPLDNDWYMKRGNARIGIRRHDEREVCEPWQFFQDIKDEFLGPGVTAVEVFPRASALVNVANMRWLWAPKDKLNIGFNGGVL